MPVLTCEVCGNEFVQGVGKPARTCPTHRGMKLPSRKQSNTATATSNPISEPSIATTATAVTSLPNEPVNEPINDPAPVDMSSYRTNRYEGKCYRCHETVEAEGGLIYKVDPNAPSKPFHADCLRAYLLANTPSHVASTPNPVGAPTTPLINQGNAEEAKAMLESLLATMAPSINEEGVRAIVNEAIAEATSEERIHALLRSAHVQRHEIVINNEPVDMPTVHHHLLPAIVKRIAAGIPGKRLNLFLPGPAGSGKSTVAKQAANALSLPFASMSLGPTTPTHKFFGYQDANGRDIHTDFYRIYHETGGVFLIDEIDNGHPGLLAELNQALANDEAAFAWGMCSKHPEFRCVATGNTFGKGPDRLFVGRNILDAATLDRFVIKEFPIDEAMETRAALAFSTADNQHEVARYVSLVQSIRKSVTESRMQIVVSPRASIDGAMMLSAGIPLGEVIEERLIPGMAEDTRKALGINVSTMGA